MLPLTKKKKQKNKIHHHDQQQQNKVKISWFEKLYPGYICVVIANITRGLSF